MKDFVVYTLARIGLFVGTLLVFVGVFAAAGVGSLFWPVVLAAVTSGVASYYLLRGPREKFAANVSGRAATMSRRLEESRAKEDQD